MKGSVKGAMIFLDELDGSACRFLQGKIFSRPKQRIGQVVCKQLLVDGRSAVAAVDVYPVSAVGLELRGFVNHG